MSRHLLLTGFGSFPNNPINPTLDIIHDLNDKKINNFLCSGIEIPVSYNLLKKQLPSLYKSNNWDAIIHLGLAAERDTISIEKVALNLIDSHTPDNDGKSFLETEIIKNQNCLYSTLPLQDINTKLLEQNISSEISYSAGVYVCNFTMYQCLHYLKQNGLSIPAGFIHIPSIESMNLETAINGTKIIINSL